MVVRDVEETTGGQKASKSLQRELFLEPQGSIPRSVTGGFALGGIDQHPVFAIGHNSKPHAGGMKQLASPDPRDIPNNHFAYAIQWFLFAGVAAAIYAIALWKRMRP